MDVTWVVGALRFEWDHAKAESNLARHGISFPEAEEVFFDPFARYLEPQEVDGEGRVNSSWREPVAPTPAGSAY